MLFCLTQKQGYALSFGLCAISSILVMFAEMHEVEWFVPFGVLVSKASVTCAFCFLYFTTVDYFQSSYLGLAIGMCNVFGRGSTILSPIVAEQGEPLPMMSCAVLCALSFFMCLNL